MVLHERGIAITQGSVFADCSPYLSLQILRFEIICSKGGQHALHKLNINNIHKDGVW